MTFVIITMNIKNVKSISNDDAAAAADDDNNN